MSMQPLLSTTVSATAIPISQVNAGSSIDALPPRLLLEIFNFVYEGEQVECDPPTCVTCSEAEGSPEPHLVWRVMTNPYSQSLFPYSVANVSRRWRDIMTTVPEYWTRLVFFLDSESDLGGPSRQLSWSHDLPLDVNVMRRSYASGERNDLERRRVREVTEALMPHMERCTMLSFEVIYSSSLPSVLRDLSLSTFTALEGLVLRSFEDDGLAPYQPGPSTLIAETHFPLLTTLVIDGANFIDLCAHIINSVDSRCFNPFQQLQRLTVKNLTSVNTLPMNTVLENILIDRNMPILYSLRLVNVYFTPARSPEQPYLLTPSYLELENMDGVVVDNFFDTVEFHDLEYTCLTKTEITNSFRVPTSWSVTLENFDQHALPTKPFIAWRGRTLDIVNCPGFTDDFLNIMSNPSYMSWGEFGCPNLQELHIVDCPNFTVQTLKTMIANRNESLGDHHALEHSDRDNPPVITELHVIGLCPSLSLEDRLWFQKKVALFQWDTE